MTDDLERVTPLKTERPRDEFGRPLPRDAEARLVLPDFDVLSIDECHHRGIEYFDAAVYFGAHEAWETAWRLARKHGHPDEEFFKGLSQLGAGYTHYQRGNPRGAHTLMQRGVGRIRAYGARSGGRHRAIDVDALATATEENMARLDGLTRADALPAIETPRVGVARRRYSATAFEPTMNIRALSPRELSRLSDIDVGEMIERSYRLVDGTLRGDASSLQRPSWSAVEWARQLEHWQRTLLPDVWLAAFEGDALIGEASLRYRLTETMAQLTTLHVDRLHRRRGVARRLLAEVTRLARESGATSMYVSAAETESAVEFYLSQGFVPSPHPDPRLFALEPADIHMVTGL